MALMDTNAIILKYLTTSSLLTNPLLALIKTGMVTRIYCPRAPENAALPNVTFFTRGGKSDPDVVHIFSPSVQFDCWADNPIKAREVYRTLYDALQGVGNAQVVVNGATCYITKAREEVQGQDLVDEIPGYFRVLAFFQVTVRDNL